MFDSIRDFFQDSMAPETHDVRAPESKQDIRLAACALLVELAYADSEFTDDERAHLESAVGRQFGLEKDDVEELLRLAEQQRRGAVDLWQFTNLIAEEYSLGQKMVLLEIMWGVVYSDGELGRREDYLMRKICNLLRLEPGYLAQTRRRVELDGGLDGG